MRLALASLAVLALAACATPCEQETNNCGCYARKECTLVTDSCWCPGECDANVRCICGGGGFLRCETTK